MGFFRKLKMNATIKTDKLISDYSRNKYIDLSKVLPELISYLRRKYKTKITFAVRENPKNFLDLLDAPGWMCDSTNDELKNDFIYFNQHYLSKIRHINKDYREAFILGKRHAVLIVYVRENGHEVLLLMDSKGSTESGFIELNTGIKTHSLTLGRQIDGWSCYIDALVLGRDITAVNTDTGTYKITNLLTKLNLCDHQIQQLPDELLKTAQSTYFIKQYRYKLSDTIIHNNETLDNFKERYTDKNVLCRKSQFDIEKCRDVSNYARLKTIKYTDIAEIQYYIDQIENEIGRELTDEEWSSFRDAAKAEFKIQGTFLDNIFRKGLFDLAENFMESLEDKMPDLIDAPDVYDHSVEVKSIQGVQIEKSDKCLTETEIKQKWENQKWSFVTRNPDTPVLLFDVARNSIKKPRNETVDESIPDLVNLSFKRHCHRN
ncbi:MAG TPA: hypothetical protein VLJ15_01385 [Gammaproteobacteria bacterium]|nr:hypothetical protein [Gammaproteobacteria bacterium]